MKTRGETAAVLDVRTYRLAPGGRQEFDRLLRTEVMPMLEDFGIRVVAFGPSLDDERGYALIRAFHSPSQRDEELAAFYGSDEWRRRFDDRVGALIEDYHVVLLETPGERGAQSDDDSGQTHA